MKFNLMSSNGKAGEYYFAYWMSRYFKWPCRLLDIDVGVDAQVEIFDDCDQSTGDFLAIQVKTSEDANPNTSIKLRNLEYWKTIDDPVVLISITLIDSEPKIYWKQINDSDIDKYIWAAAGNDSETTTIRFNDRNLIVPGDKPIFAKLPYKSHIDRLTNVYTEVNEICDEVNSVFWSEKEQEYSIENFWNMDNMDILSIDFYLNKYESVLNRLDEITSIKSSMPKIDKFLTGLPNIETETENLSSNMDDLIDLVRGIDTDYGNEFYHRWATSANHKIIAGIFESKYQLERR